jgi:hypothetical protein
MESAMVGNWAPGASPAQMRGEVLCPNHAPDPCWLVLRNGLQSAMLDAVTFKTGRGSTRPTNALIFLMTGPPIAKIGRIYAA